MSYDDEGCTEDCHCRCAVCRLHVDEEVSWGFASTEAQKRLNDLACETLGHRPVNYFGKYSSCCRCGKHLSGPEPTTQDMLYSAVADMGRYINYIYTPGMNAVLVSLKDPALY